MTAKPRSNEQGAGSKPAEAAKMDAVKEWPNGVGECVVDAPYHVGRAVNGKVCSYHAVSHMADGTPRSGG